MLPQDYAQYAALFPRWKAKLQFACEAICLLSPNFEQRELFARLFPRAVICTMPHTTWNLNESGNHLFDLCFAANVFQCSDSPEVWFSNVLRASKRFWIQDIATLNRGANNAIFGPPEDRMRFRYSGVVESNFGGAYDLRRQETRIDEFVTYEARRGSVSFIADMRGNVPEQALLGAPRFTLQEKWATTRHHSSVYTKRFLKKNSGPLLPLLKACQRAMSR